MKLTTNLQSNITLSTLLLSTLFLSACNSGSASNNIQKGRQSSPSLKVETNQEKKQRCAQPAAPGVDWHECNKSSANLERANLERANLSNTKFYNANLSNANLKQANLTDADLRLANLDNSNMTLAILIGANLSSATAVKATLEKAILEKTKLFNTSFESANLKLANLSFTNMKSANLAEANASSAIFAGANISSAIFKRTKLYNANFESVNAWATNFSQANMKLANLAYAKMKNADLTEANASSATFQLAEFDNTNLTRAKLYNANLRGTDLSKAITEGTDLRDSDNSPIIKVKRQPLIEQLDNNTYTVSTMTLQDVNFLRNIKATTDLYDNLLESWESGVENPLTSMLDQNATTMVKSLLYFGTADRTKAYALYPATTVLPLFEIPEYSFSAVSFMDEYSSTISLEEYLAENQLTNKDITRLIMILAASKIGGNPSQILYLQPVTKRKITIRTQELPTKDYIQHYGDNSMINMLAANPARMLIAGDFNYMKRKYLDQFNRLPNSALLIDKELLVQLAINYSEKPTEFIYTPQWKRLRSMTTLNKLAFVRMVLTLSGNEYLGNRLFSDQGSPYPSGPLLVNILKHGGDQPLFTAMELDWMEEELLLSYNTRELFDPNSNDANICIDMAGKNIIEQTFEALRL